jgi:hypothetical protein
MLDPFDARLPDTSRRLPSPQPVSYGEVRQRTRLKLSVCHWTVNSLSSSHLDLGSLKEYEQSPIL